MRVSDVFDIEEEAKKIAKVEVKRLMEETKINLTVYEQQMFMTGFRSGVLEMSARIGKKILGANDV